MGSHSYASGVAVLIATDAVGGVCALMGRWGGDFLCYSSLLLFVY